MHAGSMAVKECGACQQYQSELALVSNRIFRSETIADNSQSDITMTWKPDVKRRKLTQDKHTVHMKNNHILKPNECCVITAVRTLPDTFVKAKKAFNVIMFWENKSDCDRSENCPTVLRTDLHNQCIGRLFLTVEDFVNGSLEIALTSKSSECTSYDFSFL